MISDSVTNAAEDLAIHIYDFTAEQASAQLKVNSKNNFQRQDPIPHGPLTTEIPYRPSELRSVVKNVLESHTEAGDKTVCHYKGVNSPCSKGHTHVASGIVVMNKIRGSGTL